MKTFQILLQELNACENAQEWEKLYTKQEMIDFAQICLVEATETSIPQAYKFINELCDKKYLK